MDFHGKRLSNETHRSTTDPEARLYRKRRGREAKLSFMAHALMENRNGLIVDACVTEANGHAERTAALAMIETRADRPNRITLSGDRKSHRIDTLKDTILAALGPDRDLTIEETRQALAAKGLVFGFGTLQRFFRRHKITRKKRPLMRASRAVQTSC